MDTDITKLIIDLIVGVVTFFAGGTIGMGKL